MKVKAATYKFQDAFINGDTAVDANSFDGLKKRLTGSQVITAATNGLAVLGADDAARQSFLDQFDALIAAVPGGPDALYMNASIRSKLLSSMRRLNIYTQPVGRLPQWMVQEGVGANIQAMVPTYNGIPLFDIGNKADGTAIIPQTETTGSSNVTSSIYAVRWTENEATPGVAGLSNGNIDVRDLGEIDDKPVFRTRIEFYCGMATFGNGAARLAGVLNS
jgi:hypothetical protein